MAVTSGTPGTGKLQFIDLTLEEPLFQLSSLSNCHSLDVHPDGETIAVTTTVRGSNGNGRKVDDEGNYIGNTSPIQILVPGNAFTCISLIICQLPLLADVLIKKSKQHRSAEGPTGILVLLLANFGPRP